MRRLFVLIISSVSLFSCDDGAEENGLTTYQEEVITYFQDVALGFESGTASNVTRKWNVPMKLFIGGDPEPALVEELNLVISEINDLATDGFSISLTTDSLSSNSYIFFGSGSDFVARFPPAAQHVASNWGLFSVWFDGHNNLYRSVMYVDVIRTTELNARKHLLREELTQSLGLGKDSPLYPFSIFQSSWTTTTSFAKIDKDLIRLLYHPGMYAGLNKELSRTVLTPLVKELKLGM